VHPFYGIIGLAGRIRDQTIQERFIVGQLNEDAILGMPFSQRHVCRFDFSKSAMLMGDRELVCVDKFGRPLAGGVQVVRNCMIPGHSRATIRCKVNNSQISGLGVVESAHTRIQLTRSLNRLTERGEILVQCVNPFSEAVKLPSGSVLGHFHSVQEENIGPSLGDATEGPQQRRSQGQGTVPSHVQELYKAACDGYASNGERQVTAKLLCRYNDVPHHGDHDAGLNRAVHHEVPLVAEAVPIRQPTRRLGPRKRERDRGPPWNEYDWDQGQLQQKAGTPPGVVQNLRANPVLAGNVRELRKLQENPPGVIADVYRAKKKGRRPLPEPDAGPEVQKPPGGGAPSGGIGKEATVTSRLETPPVRHNSPRVSIPPPAVTTPPVQSTRQPPEYRKDLVCDCAISGKYKSLFRCRTGRPAKKRGSYEHHGNINFCLGGITNEIHPPEIKSPSHVSQPRCSVVSYADAVKSRRAKNQ